MDRADVDSEPSGPDKSLHRKIFRSKEIVLPTEYTVDDLLIEAQSPDFREDPYYQAEVVCRTQTLWEAFTKEQRETFAILTIPHVRRFHDRAHTDAQSKLRLLSQIMALPDDAAVRQALAWDPSRFKEYEPEDWEEGYTNLPGFIGRFVDCFKESTHPAPFFAWAAIALVGVACKWNIYTPIGGDEITNNFFMFFVGEKASGKSYASKCATRVLKRTNQRVNTTLRVTPLGEPPKYVEMSRPDLWMNVLPQDGTMESLVERLHKIRQIPMQQVVTDPNTGAQQLQSTHRNCSASGCLFVDEVSEQFGRDDWHSAKKIAAYTSMATSDSRSRMTIRRGDRSYDQQAFSMIVCGAIEWFRGSVTPAMMEGGFIDRAQFIYRRGTNRIYTATQVPIVDPIAVEKLAEDLIPLVVPPSTLRRQMRFTPDAEKELNRLSEQEFLEEQKIANEHLPRTIYKSSAIRREHMKIKVAACLAISDSLGKQPPDEPLDIMPISIEHVRLANWLVCNEDAYFDRFLREVNMTPHKRFYQFVYDQCSLANWGWMRESDLFSACLKHKNIQIKRKNEFVTMMHNLRDAGLVQNGVEPLGNKQGGRMTKAWRGVKEISDWLNYLR